VGREGKIIKGGGSSVKVVLQRGNWKGSIGVFRTEKVIWFGRLIGYRSNAEEVLSCISLALKAPNNFGWGGEIFQRLYYIVSAWCLSWSHLGGKLEEKKNHF